MTDPLAGLRTQIVDWQLKVLRWPADQPCPVKVGDRFPIRGGTITIEINRVTRKLVRGKGAEWHATFIRHEKDRPQLLRFTPPTRPPRVADQLIGLTETERARRESAYTSSLNQASPEEPESVGPDWEDPHRMNRELNRQHARREQEIERQEAAARRELGRLLRGLTLDQREEMLRDLCHLLNTASHDFDRAA